MASLSSFVGVAGSARYLIAIISSTLVYELYSSNTPGARLATLRRLLSGLKSQQSITDMLLKDIPKKELVDPAFKDLNRREFILNSFSSRLHELENLVASAGIWKWIPLYLNSDIVVLSAELMLARKDTERTTVATNSILKQLKAENPELLWLKDTEKRGEPVRGASDGSHSDRDANGRSGTPEDAMQVVVVKREDNPEDAMQVIPVSWEDNPEDVDPREVDEGLQGSMPFPFPSAGRI